MFLTEFFSIVCIKVEVPDS